MEIQRINAEQTLPLRQQVLWPSKSIEFCKVDEDETGYHYGSYVNGELGGGGVSLLQQWRSKTKEVCGIFKSTR